MKSSKKVRSKSVLIFVALSLASLVFQLGVVDALAQDKDGDGISDAIENAGITLPNNLKLAAGGSSSIPKCDSVMDRSMCIDPDSVDLFVIIERAPGGNIPEPSTYPNDIDPLGIIPAGLGVATHELVQDRNISTSQEVVAGCYAVKVVEKLDSPAQFMGLSTYGVPYNGSTAIVWTKWIKDWTSQKCNEACFTNSKTGSVTCYVPSESTSFECRNMATGTVVDMKKGESLDRLNKEFIQNIVSHEVSHMIYLATGADTFDHHYPLAEGVLMEQFIDVKATVDRKGNVDLNLYISQGYTREDKSKYQLY